MKTFLTYTSIIEAITGVALVIVPSSATLLLLQTQLDGSLPLILSMVGGSAIFSLALSCWLARTNVIASVIAVKALMVYNFAVASILFYGAMSLGFKGPALWTVIVFHFIQTVICIRIIQKKPVK